MILNTSITSLSKCITIFNQIIEIIKEHEETQLTNSKCKTSNKNILNYLRQLFMLSNSPKEQKATLKGLACLKYHQMEYKLRMFFQNRKSSQIYKSLHQQSRQHYNKILKTPLKLKDDPQWKKQKQCRRKIREQIRNKLEIDYFQNKAGRYYYNNTQLSNCKSYDESNPQNIKFKDILKNFNQKSLTNAQINHIYNQQLENRFTPKKKENRLKTQGSQIFPSQPDPIIKLANSKSFVSPTIFSSRRKRSVTTTVKPTQLFSLNKQQATNRSRKLSKLSKMSSNNQKSFRVGSGQSNKQLYHNCKIAENILIQMMKIKSKQQILKEALENQFKTRYQNDVIGLPLTIGLTGNIHLRSTLANISKISLSRVHKICFLYFDFNKNGIIDQMDLFQLLQKIDKIPELQKDYIKFINYLARFNNKVLDNACPINSSRNLNSDKPISKITVNSDLKQIVEQDDEFLKYPKLFTQIINQNDQIVQKKLSLNKNITNVRIGINYQRFQAIFKNQRPAFFYDLVSYFFGIQTQEILNPPTMIKSIRNLNVEYKKLDTFDNLTINITINPPTDILIQKSNTYEVALQKFQQMKKEQINLLLRPD